MNIADFYRTNKRQGVAMHSAHCLFYLFEILWQCLKNQETSFRSLNLPRLRRPEIARDRPGKNVKTRSESPAQNPFPDCVGFLYGITIYQNPKNFHGLAQRLQSF